MVLGTFSESPHACASKVIVHLFWFVWFRQQRRAHLLQNPESLKVSMFDAVRMSPLDVLSTLSHPALLPRRLASEDRTNGFLSSFGWAQLKGVPSWKWRREGKRGPGPYFPAPSLHGCWLPGATFRAPHVQGSPSGLLLHIATSHSHGFARALSVTISTRGP